MVESNQYWYDGTMPYLSLHEAPQLIEAGYSPTGFKNKEESGALDFWQFHFYLYDGQLQDEGLWIPFAPGWVSLTPPKHIHQIQRPSRSPHYYVHFKTSKIRPVQVPRLWKVSGEISRLTEELLCLTREVHSKPERSRARWWNFLFTVLDEKPEAKPSGLPKGLDSALHYLEKNLHVQSPLAFLSERLGLSRSHVGRLFQKHLGQSPAAWHRRRLAERASLLLGESHLSPAQIAESLGIRDLQRFNKLMRKEFGASPRKLRREKSS